MIEILKELFGEDYNNALFPIDRKLKIISDLGIDGMSTENIRYTINEFVRRYAKTYLEIGSYRGSTLISSAIYNNDVRCISIDNFSEFDQNGTNKSTLLNNIQKANVSNIELYDMDYVAGVKHIFDLEPELKIDVYFYDGNHTYDNQLNGLNILTDYMSDSCIIFVDDINCECVDTANDEWLKNNPDFKCIKIFTEGNCSKTWWNGFTIMYRNIDKV